MSVASGGRLSGGDAPEAAGGPAPHRAWQERGGGAKRGRPGCLAAGSEALRAALAAGGVRTGPGRDAALSSVQGCRRDPVAVSWDGGMFCCPVCPRVSAWSREVQQVTCPSPAAAGPV